MKKGIINKSIFTSVILVIFAFNINSQTSISGIVKDKKGITIIGANVFIEDSYDGGVTDIDGNFEFTTDLTGAQTIIITYLGFETKKIKSDITDFKNISVTLRESAMTLDAVEISASTFKAGDNSKLAVLEPLDIVTTAGSMGDVIASLQTLPGTQANAEDGRLFVRGGDARETAIYIDELKVFTPFSRTVGGTPTRGRYSPFLFKGVSFSTGGYSAGFGQALSGILEMNTIDNPAQTETNLSLMTIGVGVGHIQKWDKQSISVNAAYTDLTPYYKLAQSRLNLTNPFRSFSGESVYRYNTKNGIFKSYIAGDRSSIDVAQYNLDSNINESISIDNDNIYSNNTYSAIINDKVSYKTGFSIGKNTDNLIVDEYKQDASLFGFNARFRLKTIINDHLIINPGVDFLLEKNNISKELESQNYFYQDTLTRTISGSFIEADYFFSKNLAVKIGIRGEYISSINEYEVSPRVTIAQKLNKTSQLSFSYGIFRQELDQEFLYNDNSNLVNEKAEHFLLNYNYNGEKHLLRLEGFYKSYDQLLTYDALENVAIGLGNNGDGRAYGIDAFWKAKQAIKYTDFWVSYSWINNVRQFRDYPIAVTPAYSTNHNLSIVTKRWLPKLKSSISCTYTMASGRPYENPNTEGFMNERSKLYNNISFSWAYLISQQKILFISASNITGFKNEFGYRYASSPDNSGIYPGEIIRPNDDRFFFVGFFVTFSKDKTKNQLDNL